MQILLLDIETAPNTAYVWGLWQQNIAISQIMNSGYTLCWAAKWYQNKEIKFSSIYDTTPKKMLQEIHGLLDEADVVVHYNGTKFDVPVLNKDFVLHNLKPPSPYKQIDMLRVARSRFRFASNKLDYVAQALGIGRKEIDTDFDLWVRCMEKDPEAWKRMEAYNKHDVVLLEKVYDKMLPWIKNHPNKGLYGAKADLMCPSCGSNHYTKRGFTYTKTRKYQRFQCQTCGSWFRENLSSSEKGQKTFVGVA